MSESRDEPLSFSVHSLPVARIDADARTRSGRLRMLLLLLVCVAPVIASYLSYYVIRPQGRSNYGDLIQPLRPLPELSLADLQGMAVAADTLKGQWLMIVVAEAQCDARCENALLVQRQMREALGRDRDRVDKVWLVLGAAPVHPRVLDALRAGPPVTILRTSRPGLEQWLQPDVGHALEDHLYLVDPQGNWMMRHPANPDLHKLKRDLERLLKASASWDLPGR